MEYNINDPKNIIGFMPLLKNDNIQTILELERQIINGAANINEEEENDTEQYKKEMERLSSAYNIPDEETPREINWYDGKAKPEEPQRQSYDYPADTLLQDIEDNQLRSMTNEQKKQTYVDDALHGIEYADDRGLEFDLEQDRIEDEKNTLLDQIDMLRMTLEDDGIDVKSIPIVTKDTSITDIQNVYKIMCLKNDRNRYCTFAEEIIMSAAHGLEYLFDGEKDWFGRRPDLGGWSQSVKIKLRRSRFHTSTIVKEIMQDYSLNNRWQLFLELIPSLFMYSRKKKLANHDSLATDDQYNDAINRLNETSQI